MSSSTPLTLSDVKEKFALWRATRGSKRQKIPDTLWDSIYQIAPHHKTTVIARELRLNLTDVKKHLHTYFSVHSSQKTTDFVDVPHSLVQAFSFDFLNPHTIAPSIILEIKRVDGTVMTLTCATLDHVKLVTTQMLS